MQGDVPTWQFQLLLAAMPELLTRPYDITGINGELRRHILRGLDMMLARGELLPWNLYEEWLYIRRLLTSAVA